MTTIRQQLDYRIAAGALAPYVAGLQDGRAVAARRLDGEVSFPPAQAAGANGGVEWVELSGLGSLIARTDGPGGSFGLVHFDGADNRATVRILNPSAAGTRIALAPTGEGVPALLVTIIGDDE